VLKRELGDSIAVSDSLIILGWDALVSGDFDRAAAYLEDSLGIARELADTLRMSMALGNLGQLAILQGRHEEALEPLRETLLLCIRRGDRRGGPEVVLGLAAAAAGLGADELSVRLGAVSRALMADAGIVYEPLLLEQLEPLISLARKRLAPERAAALEAEVGVPTLELALELLDASHGTSVPPQNAQ
jgi:tetratricopeptide (TPR) repeat protein